MYDKWNYHTTLATNFQKSHTKLATFPKRAMSTCTILALVKLKYSMRGTSAIPCSVANNTWHLHYAYKLLHFFLTLTCFIRNILKLVSPAFLRDFWIWEYIPTHLVRSESGKMQEDFACEKCWYLLSAGYITEKKKLPRGKLLTLASLSGSLTVRQIDICR